MPSNGYIEFSNPVSVIFSKKLPKVSKISMRPLFTDNSFVCYKDHSLNSCGVGTVKNSHHKIRKT